MYSDEFDANCLNQQYQQLSNQLNRLFDANCLNQQCQQLSNQLNQLTSRHKINFQFIQIKFVKSNSQRPSTANQLLQQLQTNYCNKQLY